MHEVKAARSRTSVCRLAAITAVGLAAAVGFAACGDSSSTTSTSSGSAATTFRTANVAGVGTVLVDGRGWTVYLLTAPGQKNVPCDDESGCTKIWPDLPLPEGTTAATAGSGVQASLLGTMKLADGETYPTYNGYLMYEYAADGGPAHGRGQGIVSFGGTWYAITPAGEPAKATGVPSPTTVKASGGGAYGY